MQIVLIKTGYLDQNLRVHNVQATTINCDGFSNAQLRQYTIDMDGGNAQSIGKYDLA
jgi:hypothetical protein